MTVDKNVKRKVLEDWQNAFPELTKHAKNKFYKVVGACILGIELIKSPYMESYSPYFVIYPIWKKDVKKSLDYPIFLKDFRDKKGFQYNVPFEKHSLFFDELLESIKQQTPLPLEGNISFKKIASAIDDTSKKPPLSASPNSYLQAVLQEAKLKIALFISTAEAQKVFEQISKRNWDLNHFRLCGINVNEWLQSLQEEISDREGFFRQIEVNKSEKKISKLKNSQLTS